MIRAISSLLLLLAAPAAAASDPAALLERGLATYAARDYAAARAAFAGLANQGSAVAETMLGAIYAHGEGVGADSATAVSYWYRAANRGYAPAQLALAQALAAGDGVPRNLGDAWLWAQLAVRYGDGTVATAARTVTAAVRPGLSPAELAALQKRVDGWRPWAAAAR